MKISITIYFLLRIIALVVVITSGVGRVILNNTAIASQPIKNEPEILLRRILLTRRAFDVFDDLFGRLTPSSDCLSHALILGGYGVPETLS